MRLAGRGGPAPQCVGERQHELWRARAGEGRARSQPSANTHARGAKRLKSPGIMSMREKRDARDGGRGGGRGGGHGGCMGGGRGRRAGAGRLMVQGGGR